MLHVRPNAEGPLRALVIATALVLEVLRGNGTTPNDAVRSCWR